MSLDQYINCYENCNMRHVEALAMLGLVEDVFVENCGKPRLKKIIVRLFNGKTVSSACYFDEEVDQSMKIIRVYIGLAKRANSIGALKIAEDYKTED